MLSPPSFPRGLDITSAAFRAALQRLSDCIRERTPQPGAGTRIQPTPSGFSISTDRPRPITQADFPYMFVPASTTEAEVTTPKISLVPGTVDGISPVIGADTLDTTPAPVLELTADARNIIVLKVTYTAATSTAGGYTFLLPNGTITDPEILSYEDGTVPADTDPTTSDPEGTYYQRLGFVDVDSAGIIGEYANDTVRASLVSHYCPGSTMWYSSI